MPLGTIFKRFEEHLTSDKLCNSTVYFQPCVQDQKGSFTTNACSCNLIGLPTFLQRTQKPCQSDETLFSTIALCIVVMCEEDRGWIGDYGKRPILLAEWGSISQPQTDSTHMGDCTVLYKSDARLVWASTFPVICSEGFSQVWHLLPFTHLQWLQWQEWMNRHGISGLHSSVMKLQEQPSQASACIKFPGVKGKTQTYGVAPKEGMDKWLWWVRVRCQSNTKPKELVFIVTETISCMLDNFRYYPHVL